MSRQRLNHLSDYAEADLKTRLDTIVRRLTLCRLVTLTENLFGRKPSIERCGEPGINRHLHARLPNCKVLRALGLFQKFFRAEFEPNA